MTVDRIFVGILLLAGILWLRARARKLPEERRTFALVGLVVFLVPALLAGKWLFDRLQFGRYPNLALELAGIAAIFAVMGLVFLRPGAKTR